MLFFLSKKRRIPPLNAVIGSLICFGLGVVFTMIAVTRPVVGQLFPFTNGAIALALFSFGIITIQQASEQSTALPPEINVSLIGLIVTIPTCLIISGIILDAYTRGLGWHKTSATVTGMPYFNTMSGRQHRKQYTVQYQYNWQDKTFNGATEATPTTIGDEPLVATSTRHSFDIRPLTIGDRIIIKINPQHPDQSFYPQTPPVILYPVFLLFLWVAWGCWRRLEKKQTPAEFKP